MSIDIMKINRADCIKFQEFDEKHNVETSHPIVEAERKDYGDFKPSFIDNSDRFPGSRGYQNTALLWIDEMNNYFSNVEKIEDYSFIDIGAGKGRAILHTLATNDIYKDYTGLEIDPELATIFMNNINSTNIKINKPVEVKCVDVRDYICTNHPAVYFIFQPFDQDVWNTFMEKNHETLKAAKAYFAFIHRGDYEWYKYFETEPVLVTHGLTIIPT